MEYFLLFCVLLIGGLKAKDFFASSDDELVEKAKKGEECGILYEGNVKIEEGDVLQIYTEERRKGEL